MVKNFRVLLQVAATCRAGFLKRDVQFYDQKIVPREENREERATFNAQRAITRKTIEMLHSSRNHAIKDGSNLMKFSPLQHCCGDRDGVLLLRNYEPSYFLPTVKKTIPSEIGEMAAIAILLFKRSWVHVVICDSTASISHESKRYCAGKTQSSDWRIESGGGNLSGALDRNYFEECNLLTSRNSRMKVQLSTR